MELWDIYDACFQKTGKLHERGKQLKEGEYHLVVHIFPINQQKQILVQKRSDTVEWFPGSWAVTGGSALNGEDAWQACQRELKEELGIQIQKEDAQLFAILKRHDSFNAVWVIRSEVSEKDLKLQKEEVAQAKWIEMDNIKKMMTQGSFHKYQYFDWLMDYIGGITWK
mgnify:CR=1 FL=1